MSSMGTIRMRRCEGLAFSDWVDVVVAWDVGCSKHRISVMICGEGRSGKISVSLSRHVYIELVLEIVLENNGCISVLTLFMPLQRSEAGLLPRRSRLDHLKVSIVQRGKVQPS